MTIRAVIWDVGGVLVRTEDLIPRKQLAEDMGKTAHQLENEVYSSEIGIQAQLGKIGIVEFWEKTLQMLGLTPQDQVDFRQRFWGGDELDKDLVAFIRRLRKNYKTGLLSNALPGLRSLLQDEWRIDDAFDVLVISSEVGLMKPDPQIYRLTAEELGVALAEAVLIDDNTKNIESARAVGMPAIHFLSTDQAITELETFLHTNKVAL